MVCSEIVVKPAFKAAKRVFSPCAILPRNFQRLCVVIVRFFKKVTCMIEKDFPQPFNRNRLRALQMPRCPRSCPGRPLHTCMDPLRIRVPVALQCGQGNNFKFWWIDSKSSSPSKNEGSWFERSCRIKAVLEL